MPLSLTTQPLVAHSGPDRGGAVAEFCLVINQDIGGGDGELAAARHGIARVDGEVHDHLLELAGIGLHATEGGIKFGGKFDVLPDQAAEHFFPMP